MSEAKGKRNGYTCRSCGWRIVTVNRDAGVTPFMLGCANDVPSDEDREKAKAAGQAFGSKGCGAFMESHFYRIPQDAEPSHEWYSPDAKERKRMRHKGDPNFEHVERGGLLLRRISDIDGASFFQRKIDARKHTPSAAGGESKG